MKKKKFITPKVRVIKIEAEALLAATGEQTQGVSASQGSRGGKGQFNSNSTVYGAYDPENDI